MLSKGVGYGVVQRRYLVRSRARERIAVFPYPVVAQKKRNLNGKVMVNACGGETTLLPKSDGQVMTSGRTLERRTDLQCKAIPIP